MRYDLVIKGGTVIDGSGAERVWADIGIADGRIAAIGTLDAPSDEVIDARGCVVAPGFIDGHTHLDAQMFWEPTGSSSCYQGVTTAVFGNCGFTLAPVSRDHTDLLLEHFEAAEALPLEALRSGVDIQWETFPEYLQVLDELPMGINCATYVGHSALRIHAMGERAFEPASTAEDLRHMTDGLCGALRAGAIGFSTSRVSHQRLSDGRLIASGHAPWAEVQALVRTMADLGVGVFELAREKLDPARIDEYDFCDRLRALALETGRPTTLGVFHAVDEGGAADLYMAMIDAAAREGGQMLAQVHTNTMYDYCSFLAKVPFGQVEEWRALQSLSPDQRRGRLQDPAARAALVAALQRLPEGEAPDYDGLYIVRDFRRDDLSAASLARQRGCHPGEALIAEALDHDLRLLFRTPFANVDSDQVLALLKHPLAIPTFSDAGAHVSEVADTCIPSVLLGEWVRERAAFTLEEAVHMITAKIAAVWGFADRGLLRPGYAADLVIFDPDRIGPTLPEVVHDFPTGMARIRQGCDGIEATIVNGRALLRRGAHTGALPGQLLKGPLAAH